MTSSFCHIIQNFFVYELNQLFEIESLPTLFYIPKSHSSSSQRVQAASVAFMAPPKMNRHVLKNRRNRMNRRRKKQQSHLIEIKSIPPKIHLWSWDESRKLNLVFNGAVHGDTTYFLPTKKPWKCLSIRDGDLFVPSYPPPQQGLTFTRIYGESLPSPFILVPRSISLL